MSRLLPFIFTSILVVFLPYAHAQSVSQLTDDPDLFTSDLSSFMGRNLSDAQILQFNEFTARWDSAMFNNSEMQSVITSVNQLIARNARPVPHMINYTELLCAFLEHDEQRRHYPVWERSFADLLRNTDRSLQTINEFISGTTRLISQNIVSASNAVTWMASRPDFSFVFEDSLRIVFAEFDLMAFNHIDTLTVFRTSGSFYPLSRTWEGKGGMVTWERAGLGPGEAYALLGDYSIDLTRSEYHADSASFIFSRYFQSPVTGRLTDRVMTTSRTADANFPAFTSYRQEFSIRNIYKLVDYEGGLTMKGARLIGSGGGHGNARLIFYREAEKLLLAESDQFVFRTQGASSASTSIFIYLEDQIVFHPDLYLNFIESTGELSLNRNQKVVSQSPWDNQFHQVDMSFARLIWKTDEHEMQLTMPRAGSIGNADFKSHNYFDQVQYQRLQGMDTHNPLVLLRNFAASYGSELFTAEAYSRFLRRPVSGVRHQLLELTLQGFVFYDTETDNITLRRRLYDYLQSNIQRIDYDIINFTSSTTAPQENAIIDLGTFDMKINGIPRVFISNSQNVNLFPANNTVTMKKNRNFLFDGIINAGSLTFSGNNFAFNYDEFSINLQNVDSIRLRARFTDPNTGQTRFTDISNLIRNVTGELLIDRPDNKSSRVHYPDFPKFSSTGNSYVFYEEPYIQKGAYRSEDFYYELQPFEMDSLNSFRNEDIRFRGKLISSGIFPDIEEPLTLQKDYSLGIRHTTTEAGIAAYGGKGQYHHEILLNNQGLRGSGKFNYLSAEVYSEDFLFMPDSMNAHAHGFNVSLQTTGTQFPSVNSRNNNVRFLPSGDLMTIHQTNVDFSMFGNQVQLKGSLDLRPSGLSGTGSASLEKAVITSGHHLFSAESFSSENGSFLLRGTENKISVSANNISSNIDLLLRKGEFSVNPVGEALTLPANSYTGNPASFSWKMDDGEMEFLSQAINDATGLPGARYISTLRQQDSLGFVSPQVILNYNTNMMTANQVKFLDVADAAIFPFQETIVIGENAVMAPLREASLITRSGEFMHEIYNASLQIQGKYSYSGSGDYDYINNYGDTQTIHFDRISVNNDFNTVASGKITETDNFLINPGFSFSGETTLLSSSPNLNFRGAARTTQECEKLKMQWLAFEKEIDPMDVMIPVPVQPVSADRERIYSGIFVANDSIHVYPAFFSERRNYADQLLITADGYMIFDDLSGEYRIASSEKLKDPGLPGNYLSLNTRECLLSGQGRLELGITLGQMEINALGSATNRVDINETSLEGIISMDFFFSEEALALMAQKAGDLPGEPVDSASYWYTGALDELLGKERAHSYRMTRGGDKQAKLPEELEKTLVLSDIKLNWNKENRSYQSAGKIGIAYINGVPVNKSFTGYLEISKRRSGDFLDFYVELDNNTWYYFGYTRGVMQAFSSDPGFVGIINDLAIRHRRANEGGSERYVFMLASDNKLEQFFKSYKSYLGELDKETLPDEQAAEEDPQHVGDLPPEVIQ
jgi:hypothetical protein